MPIVAYREDTTQNLHVYYGKSFMPLLDTTINLEQISDNSAEVQTHAYYYVDGGFIKKTTTSAPDGSIDDHVMGSYPNHNIAFSLYPLYLKPKNYLSQTTILDTEYGDNNNPSFDTAFICGDLNNDDQVSGPDFSILLTHYGHSAEADFNGDDVTNAMDFALFVKNYGEEGAYIEDTTHNWDWDG
jgi:hypothetical protein